MDQLRHVLVHKHWLVVAEGQVFLAASKAVFKRKKGGGSVMAACWDLRDLIDIFERRAGDRKNFGMPDVSAAAGSSSATCEKWIKAGALRVSVRPGQGQGNGVRLFSRLDVFVAAVLGTMRRHFCRIEVLTKVGKFIYAAAEAAEALDCTATTAQPTGHPDAPPQTR